MGAFSDSENSIAAEPDVPELINVTRFIVIVALFVAVSLVSLRSWTGNLMMGPIAPVITTQR